MTDIRPNPQTTSDTLTSNKLPSIEHPAPVPSYPQRTAGPGRRRVRRRRRSDGWLWVFIALGALGFTLLITIALIFVLRTDENTQTEALAADPDAEPTSILYSNQTGDNPDGSGEGTEVRGAIENSLVIEPWDGKERFTILLMGLDRRPGERSRQCTRTDTMIIVSLDPVNDRIGMLSIPRDTYVEIPGYRGLNRINTACILGDLQEPGNGPLLAMQTVQYNFGIRINEYMMVDFQTFISFIDRIGGIDVEVTQTINDRTYPDMNYGFDPFYIEPGYHHLDGATALKYARSRHGSDDINRARRQQQVMFAARDKVLSLDMLDDLATQALPIWNDLNEGIITGLSFDQIIKLALFAKDVPDENIHSAVVTWDYLEGYRTPGGAQVAIPNRYRLNSLMLEVFGEGYNQ
ncbi:MAG: LCP family protein [Chloroflexi bacterium]|nr:LCP family protein [Chloroflexota bacterium]